MKTFCELFLEALDDFTIKLLIVAATAALILEVSLADSDERATSWIDSFGIFCAVFVVGMVTSVNNYQKVKINKHLESSLRGMKEKNKVSFCVNY